MSVVWGNNNNPYPPHTQSINHYKQTFKIMEKTNIKTNEEIIKSLATELAKVQFLELFNIVNACETFEDAYNKLSGFNLDIENSYMKEELIYVGLQFDFNYKNLNGTIFYNIKNRKFEIYQGVYVNVDTISNPVYYIDNIYKLIDFE